MTVFDLLTEDDKNLIFEYIYSYGATGEYANEPDKSNIPIVLQEWDKQKSKYLQQLFGGDKLVLNRPYTYTMSTDGVLHNILHAIEEEGHLYYHPMIDWVYKIARQNLKYEFVSEIETIWSHSYMFCENLFYAEALASNSYGGPTGKVIFDDGEVMKITIGMKPMKIIRKLVDKYGSPYEKNLFEAFRNWHSQLLNQIHLDGTLTLSIHPLDYMTMSDNGGSWDSCMRWMSDQTHVGDYRMGTVECLNSPYIVIAYLHNPKKQFDFWNAHNHCYEHWNKKKWRELFIVQDGVISEIKGYPFQDENLTNTVLMWLKELAAQNLGWEYEDIEYNTVKEITANDGTEYHIQFSASFMYNDFGSLEKHRARLNFDSLARRAKKHGGDITWIDYSWHKDKEHHITIPYGGQATCMCCGNSIEYGEDRSNAVFCAECDRLQICPCCGEYIYGEMFEVSAYDEPICSGCYEYECSVDDLSDGIEADFSMENIYLFLGYNEYGTKVFSNNCFTTLDPNEYSNYAWDDMFKNDYRTSERPFVSDIKYVTLDDIRNDIIGTMWDEDTFDRLFGIVVYTDDWFDKLQKEYPQVEDWDVTPERVRQVLGIEDENE